MRFFKLEEIKRIVDLMPRTRPLKRFRQHQLESKIGRALIAGDMHEEGKLVVDLQDGALHVTIENPPAEQAAA
jgi:ATP-dependent Clp protease ATP-binding subunit ClpB